MIILASTTVIVALSLPLQTGETAPPAELKLEHRLASLSETFGVEIVAPQAPGKFADHVYLPAPEAECLSYLPILGRELGRYPLGFIKASGLRRICLCILPDESGKKHRGVTDSARSAIYIYPKGPAGPSYFKVMPHCLHHEIFHVIDWNSDHTYEDEDWAALNFEGFRYYLISGNTLSGVDLGLNRNVSGFITGYARMSVWEDKADLFACLMTVPWEVEKRCIEDPRIAAKTLRLKHFLKGFYPDLMDLYQVEGQKR